MTRRLSKILICLALGLFAALIAYDNVIDDANYVFVRHVMSMDTTADSVLKHRAITSPLAWQVVYAAIIACEATFGALFLAAAVALWRARRAPARFEVAKGWAFAGGTLAFLLYFLGFMVGGGEWFSMWRSHEWNGQQPAFRFLLILMAVLIYIAQSDVEAG